MSDNQHQEDEEFVEKQIFLETVVVYTAIILIVMIACLVAAWSVLR